MTSTPTAPINIGVEAFPKITGTPGNASAARRSPFPPLYRAGTEREPGTTHPTWLAQKINNSRRAARPRTCQRCNANLLVGPDHDTCAITARVDATPVSPLDEAIAILTGHTSYDLVRGELHHRDPHHLEQPDRPHPIHLEHNCPPTTPEVLF